ncbi:TetR/AcrR family transcriptional regulator [Couchioplanes azureus]|uniref:TetR/AcrR family transcriptional regulator n=1 Tax=Couchioplanes caeruleus TaxID=56438 RepID=UPI0027E3C2CA|nr:TetR/AcrR family transcriptional regulator [Couchioplanes caeruleus]
MDGIVGAAIDLADAEGLAALSMRRVAEQIGVGTMSLYTYVPGKAELIDLMLDTVYGETAKPAEQAGGWRARLEQVARENWNLYRRHPWMLQVGTARPSLGPNALLKYDYELRAVADIGLSEIEMDSVVSLVLGHAEGAARRAHEAVSAEQSTGMTDDQWWQANSVMLMKVMDVNRFPMAAAVGQAVGMAHGTAHDAAHNFEFGLQRILEGIEVFVRRNTDREDDRPGKS